MVSQRVRGLKTKEMRELDGERAKPERRKGVPALR